MNNFFKLKRKKIISNNLELGRKEHDGCNKKIGKKEKHIECSLS